MYQNTIGRLIEMLLVEDNAGDVRWVTETFQDAKLQNKLTVLSDGEEAMAYLRRQGRYAGVSTPDLILLDLNLPRKSGREVLADIKADASLSRIPVVVLTTSESEEDVLKTYDLWAQGYLSKPLQVGHLLRIIQTIEDFGLAIVKRERP